MTNFERIKNMTIEELGMFLMKVNCNYATDCQVGVSECKHPNTDNCCSICFKEWLESDCNDEQHKQEAKDENIKYRL